MAGPGGIMACSRIQKFPFTGGGLKGRGGAQPSITQKSGQPLNMICIDPVHACPDQLEPAVFKIRGIPEANLFTLPVNALYNGGQGPCLPGGEG